MEPLQDINLKTEATNSLKEEVENALKTSEPAIITFSPDRSRYNTQNDKNRRKSLSSTSNDFSMDLSALDGVNADSNVLDSLLNSEISLPVPSTSQLKISEPSITSNLNFISKTEKPSNGNELLKSPKCGGTSDLRLKLEKQISHAKMTNSALQIEPTRSNGTFKDSTAVISKSAIDCMDVLSLNGSSTEKEDEALISHPSNDIGKELDEWISKDCKTYAAGEDDFFIPKESSSTTHKSEPEKKQVVIKESTDYVSCVIPNSPKHKKSKKCKSATSASNTTGSTKSYNVCVDSPAVIETTSTTAGCDLRKPLIPPQRMAIPNKFPNCNNSSMSGDNSEKKPLVQWDSSDDSEEELSFFPASKPRGVLTDNLSIDQMSLSGEEDDLHLSPPRPMSQAGCPCDPRIWVEQISKAFSSAVRRMYVVS